MSGAENLGMELNGHREEREVKSPIITATNHPDEKLLAKSAKRNPKRQAKSAKSEKKEAKKNNMKWVKSGGWLMRFRFIHPKTKKQRLYYAKSLENLADRIDRLNIKYLLGDIEKFNSTTQKWEVIENYN